MSILYLLSICSSVSIGFNDRTQVWGFFFSMPRLIIRLRKSHLACDDGDVSRYELKGKSRLGACEMCLF